MSNILSLLINGERFIRYHQLHINNMMTTPETHTGIGYLMTLTFCYKTTCTIKI